MRDTRAKLAEQLYERIYDLVTAEPSEADRLQFPGSDQADGRWSASNATIHLAAPGIALYPEDLQLMWTRSNPRGDRNRTALFSVLVDSIPPIGTARYAQTQKRVSQAYTAVVSGANAHAAQMKPETRKMLEKINAFLFCEIEEPGSPFADPPGAPTKKIAKTAVYERYEKLIDDIADARDGLKKAAIEAGKKAIDWHRGHTKESLAGMSETDRKRAAARAQRLATSYWTTASLPFRQQLSKLQKEFNQDVSMKYVEEALDYQTTHGNELSMALLARTKELATKGDWSDPAMQVPIKVAFPSSTSFADKNSSDGWMSVECNTGQYDEALDGKHRTTSTDGGGLWGLWSFGGQGGTSKEESKSQIEHSSISASLELSFVNIIRPWFDATLFGKHVSWDAGRDQGKGGVSSGVIEEQTDDHLLPFVPMQMIVARNVELRADWSKEEKEFVEAKLEAGASVGWGPFSIGAGHESGQTHFEDHRRTGDASLKCPGIQCLGFVSWVPPASAPLAGESTSENEYEPPTRNAAVQEQADQIVDQLRLNPSARDRELFEKLRRQPSSSLLQPRRLEAVILEAALERSRSAEEARDERLVREARAEQLTPAALLALVGRLADQITALRAEISTLRARPASASSDELIAHKVQELTSLEAELDSRKRQHALIDHYDRRWQEFSHRWRTLTESDDVGSALTVPGESRGAVADRARELRALITKGETAISEKIDLAAAERAYAQIEILLQLRSSDAEFLSWFRDFGNDWFAIKAALNRDEISKQQMQQAWLFRQKTVNELMMNLQSKYGFEWDAVGSTDLGSDIDVAIVTHGGTADGTIVFDWKIVLEFNDDFVGQFGAQPGIMFDVNLYASAPQVAVIDQLADSPVKIAMRAMADAGQDVGALMKQRRYMSWEAFDEYRERLVAALERIGAGRDVVDASNRQLEEADSLYQISLRRIVDTAYSLLEARMREVNGELKRDSRYEQSKQRFDEVSRRVIEIENTADILEGQHKLIAAVDWLDQDSQKDLNMEVSNAIYVAAVEEVRRLEGRAVELLEKVPENADELAGLIARIGTFSTDAVFFANEAYLSEGPMKHIVEATQGVKFHLKAGKVPGFSRFDWEIMSDEERSRVLEKVTAERRGALTSLQCLQSFNEQLGDFLKDVNHYAKKPPGYAFYRSSKYLHRLLDGLGLLKDKLGIDLTPTLHDLDIDSSIETLCRRVGDPKRGILAVRKGEDPFQGEEIQLEPGETREDKIQQFVVEEMRQMFGVTDAPSLRDKLLELSLDVNAQCRKIVGREMIPSDVREYFRSMRSGDRDVI